MMMKQMAAIAALPFLMAACGSDDEGDTGLTGTFIDSAVGNIAYRTETHSGYTNAAGEFSYEAGETVTFSIGDIDLPSAPASDVVTPLTLANVSDVSNTTVMNIARLLQSLDTDGDASNGITISDTAHDNGTGSVDFTSATFADESIITNLVANSGSSITELISASDAEAHFQEYLDSVAVVEEAALTEALLLGKTFSITSDSSSSTQITFSSNGTGTMYFGANDPQAVSGWSINGDTITFRENPEDGTDYWNWVYTVTNITATQITADYSVTGMEDGESVDGAGGLILTLLP